MSLGWWVFLWLQRQCVCGEGGVMIQNCVTSFMDDPDLQKPTFLKWMYNLNGHLTKTTTTYSLVRNFKTEFARLCAIVRRDFFPVSLYSSTNPPTWKLFHNVFTQILHENIPNSKKAAWLDCLIALLGSACKKAARKMLVKLTPGSYFTFFRHFWFFPLFVRRSFHKWRHIR